MIYENVNEKNQEVMQFQTHQEMKEQFKFMFDEKDTYDRFDTENEFVNLMREIEDSST